MFSPQIPRTTLLARFCHLRCVARSGLALTCTKSFYSRAVQSLPVALNFWRDEKFKLWSAFPFLNIIFKPNPDQSPQQDKYKMMESKPSPSNMRRSSESIETQEAQQIRRDFRRQQVELMELTALGLNRGKTIEDLDCLKKMEELNLELSSPSSHSAASACSEAPSAGKRMSFSSLVSLRFSTSSQRPTMANPQA